MNISIGFFAKERGLVGKSHTQTHALKDGKALCGYKPAKTMQYQWCANFAYIDYVECKNCKEKLQKLTDSFN